MPSGWRANIQDSAFVSEPATIAIDFRPVCDMLNIKLTNCLTFNNFKLFPG